MAAGRSLVHTAGLVCSLDARFVGGGEAGSGVGVEDG